MLFDFMPSVHLFFELTMVQDKDQRERHKFYYTVVPSSIVDYSAVVVTVRLC